MEATTSSTPLTFETAIEYYLKARDKKEELAAQFKAECAPYDEAMTTLGNWMSAELTRLGLQNASAKGIGTVLRTETESVTCSDWEASFKWIMEGQRWDFLQHAMNKTAVVEYVKANGGEIPPGVSYSRMMGVQVRKARGASS